MALILPDLTDATIFGGFIITLFDQYGLVNTFLDLTATSEKRSENRDNTNGFTIWVNLSKQAHRRKTGISERAITIFER